MICYFSAVFIIDDESYFLLNLSLGFSRIQYIKLLFEIYFDSNQTKRVTSPDLIQEIINFTLIYKPEISNYQLY